MEDQAHLTTDARLVDEVVEVEANSGIPVEAPAEAATVLSIYANVSAGLGSGELNRSPASTLFAEPAPGPDGGAPAAAADGWWGRWSASRLFSSLTMRSKCAVSQGTSIAQV